jgi:ubiquinol-cytochrome c reductase cytochrome b subunit
MLFSRIGYTRIIDWLDDRTGLRTSLKKMLDHPIPGGSRWAYVFGSALLFVFAVMAVSGVLLTLYYVPSSDHAHASTAYIQKAVPGGALLRGLHYYGAQAMVILLLAHLTQTFLSGAYKNKRELLWVGGVALLLTALGSAFTGYLLPWDQTAYFGSKVGISIAGEIPLIGPLLQRILQGGAELSTLTLSRFFTLHAFLLPAATALLIVLHVFLFRRAGAAGPPHRQAESRVERFHPAQLFKNAMASLCLFAVLLGLAWLKPAELGPMADPTSYYLARPAWYFLPLYQLVMICPGDLVMIPAVILPGALFGILFLLPFVDRHAERHPRRRPAAVTIFALAAIGSLGLLVWSKYAMRADPELYAQMKKQENAAAAFFEAEYVPQQIGRTYGVPAPQVAHPVGSPSRPFKIFAANCANCHGASADGGVFGPSLVRLQQRRKFTSTALNKWIEGHGREPTIDGMPKFEQLSAAQREMLANFLLALDRPLEYSGEETKGIGNAAPKPPEAYIGSCAKCHGAQAEGNTGPPLIGISARRFRGMDDLLKLLDDPRAYNLEDPMPAAFPGLTAEDKQDIVEWIVMLK